MASDGFRRSLPPLALDARGTAREEQRAPAPRAPTPRGPAGLPPGYGREKLVAVPRDARLVWLYWEISPAKLARILERADPGRPELHLALAETRKPVKELACDLETGWTWIEALPGETFFAELGLADFGRPFTVLLRSEPFRMPWGNALREHVRPSIELPEELRRFRPPSLPPLGGGK